MRSRFRSKREQVCHGCVAFEPTLGGIARRRSRDAIS
jgi:hypothetical protein